VEAVVTTITNSVLVIPHWPIMAIIMLFVSKPTLLFLAVILALFGWPGPARIMTPQISSLKARPFVDMARVSGYGTWAIMFKEIVPNFLPYIVLGLTSSVSNNILQETALRIVGLGPVTVPSLGLLINWELTSGSLAQGHYAVALSPIVAVTLIFVSLNLINLGLEEVYNPRLKKITGL
jgi:peptide/nickel transport system permease protein